MERIDKIGITSLAVILILILSSYVFYYLDQSVGWATPMNAPVISASINTSSDGNYTVLIEDISVEKPCSPYYNQIQHYFYYLLGDDSVVGFRFEENGTAYFANSTGYPYPIYNPSLTVE